ncbi:MAG: hypothetical protein IT370_34600 [Deltaproteobacteria bacterium]|nr:hypothetical protein [Deltaproteobacteria bacterium]
MPMRRTLAMTLLLAAALSGCGDAGAGAPADASAGADVDPASPCAASFGDALPAGFARVDGTILAVVPPGHPTCAMPNGSHVVLQVSVAGAAYRMVVNIASTGAIPEVRFAEVPAALPAPAFSEGFHSGVALDYPTTLGLHANQAPFAPRPATQLVSDLTALLPLGAHVSVYGSGSGGASNHLIHRNGAMTDGAIVLGPDTASPRFLVFHFPDQSF